MLEQQDDEDENLGFDDNWIIQFRHDNHATIGLIWAGSIENVRREAG